MPLLGTTGGGSAKGFGALANLGYFIRNSLRFRASASAYLSRTPAGAGNRKTWTWSGWVKRGSLNNGSGYQTIFSGGATVSDTGITAIFFNPSDGLTIGGSTTNWLITSQVFRDPSAWYHIVVSMDTTNATANNRLRVYINGNEVTAFSTRNNLTLNTDYGVNQAALHAISYQSASIGVGYFDGYQTDINFIDGQALTPSDFGKTNAVTNQWVPKKFAGTYGTNGFYLKFADASAATAAAIGKDSSPNGNNWTPNNISVTAGETYDAMTDSPTNTSATVANYPVYDQLIPANVSGSGVRSISAANLYVTNSGPNGWSAIGTTMVMTSGSGKWYWEVTCSGTTSNGTMIGIHRPFTSTSTFPSAIIGYDTPPDPDGYGYYMGGNKYNNSGAGVAYGASYTAGDVIGVALDMSTAGSASITFYKNNTSQGVAFSSLTGDFFAAVSQAQANGLDINFGQRPFAYTPPTGFVALNTFNLPTPTILQGNKYMDAAIWTGNSSTQTISGLNVQADLWWQKNRSNAYNHALVDTVRGISTQLASNATGAETSYTTLTSINSDGFTVNNSQSNNVDSQVAWLWKANGGTTSSNTSGSITSTVSVNTTAGFSVVTYTGTGANATVGHGLGVAPKMIIIKNRTNAYNWGVYHQSLGATKYLNLNKTDASGTSSTYWNNTEPDSSKFYVSTSGDVNLSTNNYVAYCWAEIAGFSKFGSYTGNANADGPFIYTGFRPKFVMFKRTDSTSDWEIQDSSRSTSNVISRELYANLSDAEYDDIYNNSDFLSNGFKIRSGASSGNNNPSGGTVIYAAFAEAPFKYANAR